MFERSLVISSKTHATAAQRWTAMTSVAVQVSLAGLMVAVPLLHPEGLPFISHPPKVFLPTVKSPEVKPVERSIIPATTVVMQSNPFTAPRQIPTTIDTREEPPVQMVTTMGDPNGMRDVLGSFGDTHARTVSVTPAAPPDKPMRVSSGVMTGRLIVPISPVYPVIAKAAGVQGAVVVEALISKAGRIESLKVVSGPEMLRQAAMEAIQAARYQPFQLNGEATDVQTTITVNFRLGS